MSGTVELTVRQAFELGLIDQDQFIELDEAFAGRVDNAKAEWQVGELPSGWEDM